MSVKVKLEREEIQLTKEEMLNFWDDLYFDNSKTEYKGEVYKNVSKTNVTDYEEVSGYEYVVKRESDGKCFAYSMSESEYHGCEFFGTSLVRSSKENSLIEVFPKTITKTIYE